MLHGTLELNVSSFLTKALGTETTYAIVAYNNMTKYPDPVNGSNVLHRTGSGYALCFPHFCRPPHSQRLLSCARRQQWLRGAGDSRFPDRTETRVGVRGARWRIRRSQPTHRARYMREGSIRTATRCITRLGCIRAFRCRETAAGIRRGVIGRSAAHHQFAAP